MSKGVTDSPAKRRDCIALLCGLPVCLSGQKELVRVELAEGKPKPSKSKEAGIKLTEEGTALALQTFGERLGFGLAEDAAKWKKEKVKRG